MNPTRHRIVILLGLALTALASACAKAHPAEGLRPLPLLMFGEAPTRQAESLQPLLQWESFPRRVDLSAARNGSLGHVQNVTYEVRIWRAESPIAGPCAPFPSFAPDAFGKGPCVFPGDVAYARAGLVTPIHTVDSPLAPDTVYLWSVRAHFVLDGEPRVTQWSVLNATSVNRQLPEPRDGTLPSLGYYPYRTPGEQPNDPRPDLTNDSGRR
jgi:hypothetical protein